MKIIWVYNTMSPPSMKKVHKSTYRHTALYCVATFYYCLSVCLFFIGPGNVLAIERGMEDETVYFVILENA